MKPRSQVQFRNQFLHKSSGILPGTFLICLSAVLQLTFSSCGSDAPSEPKPPDPPIVDTTGPQITLINPAASASIGDTITLKISTNDSVDIERVEFRADNVLLPGGSIVAPPFELLWTASGIRDGQAIEFSAQAFDSTGNSRDPVKVNVNYRWTSRPTIISPSEDAIVSDTATIAAQVNGNNFPIVYVEFLRNDQIILNSQDSTAPYAFLWDASNLDTASAHILSVRAFNANGNFSLSTPMTVHYLWRLLLTDLDDAWARDISTLSVRSTSTQLQFRVRTNGAWADYRSPSDGLAFVVFLDTDQDPSTGRTGFEFFPFPINDIGAEYRLQIGTFGDSISVYDDVNLRWQVIRELTGVNISAPPNDSIFELKINLSEIGSPPATDIVAANILPTNNPFLWDFVPDQGSGHVSYTIDSSFAGSSALPSKRIQNLQDDQWHLPLSERPPSPFE